jgi:hypothetical protein
MALFSSSPSPFAPFPFFFHFNIFLEKLGFNINSVKLQLTHCNKGGK